MNFFGPGSKPTVYNVVHLTGTASDAARMGGIANNVYSTFQAAYDAAVVIQTATSQQVVLRVYNTTTTAGTTSVGNLTLTANYNSNVKIVGLSPIFSVLGTITANNAAGAGFTLTLFAENVRIGNSTTNSTGTTGNGGAVTLNITNCIFGNFNTSPTNASNSTGLGGAFTINQLGATTNNGYCIVGTITTSAITTSSTNAGAVTINSPGTLSAKGNLVVGAITTGIGSNNGGLIIAYYCKIDNIVCVSSSTTAIHIFHQCEIRGVSFTMANGASIAYAYCIFSSSGSFVHIASGTAATQPFVDMVNCKVSSTTTDVSFGTAFTNTDLKVKFRITNCYLVLQGSSTIGNNSLIINSHLIDRSGASPLFGGLGTGIEFHNCYFEHFTATKNTFSNSINVSVKLFNCKSSSGNRPTANVALPVDEQWSETVNTTDATVTTIFTYPIPTGQKLKIIYDISAVDSSNNVAGGIKQNVIKNIAGTLSKVAATDNNIVALFSDVALSGVLFNTVISGTNLLIQVTGILATNITWTANVKTITTF